LAEGDLVSPQLFYQEQSWVAYCRFPCNQLLATHTHLGDNAMRKSGSKITTLAKYSDERDSWD